MSEIKFPKRITELVRLGSRATDEKIAELKKRGKEFLPLSAYPDKKIPDEILSIAYTELDILKHPPARGLMGLREAIADYRKKQIGRTVDPDKEILNTYGAMHALQCIMLTILDPGDEVLLFTPAYFYDGTVALAGGQLVYIPLKEEDNFAWNVERLEHSITRRTKAILLNTPTNPTGFVADHECLNKIAQIAEKHELFVVCDEAYESMVYDDRKHVSILSSEFNRDRTIMVGSFTKSFSMPSWRIGHIIASENVTTNILKVLEWSILFAPYVNQRVAELVLRSDMLWLKGIDKEFQANRDCIVNALNHCQGVSFVVPQGNPFVFVNLKKLKITDEQVCNILIEKYGIPCTAGFLHKAEGYVRIPVGGKTDVVKKASERIVDAFTDMYDGKL